LRKKMASNDKHFSPKNVAIIAMIIIL
jgi:hypothetical protein